jgi:hypothetical protein
VYVDVSNGDPVHYESIQLKSLKVGESMATCHKVDADLDSMDNVVENPMYAYEAYSKGKYEFEEDVIENIYETIPGEDDQD